MTADPSRSTRHRAAPQIRDERFGMAWHSLRSLCKIGCGGADQRRAVLRATAKRNRDSTAEKNGTLVRSDIVESLGHLDAVPDPDD